MPLNNEDNFHVFLLVIQPLDLEREYMRSNNITQEKMKENTDIELMNISAF